MYYQTVYPNTCNNLNMNSALTRSTNAMVCNNILKVTKLPCFRFSYNEAHSLLTFGIQLFNSSIENDATMNSSLRTYVTLHLLYFTGVTVKSHLPATHETTYSLRRARPFNVPRFTTSRFKNSFIISSCLKAN